MLLLALALWTLTSRTWGAKIARPDKTALDQIARLNNGALSRAALDG